MHRTTTLLAALTGLALGAMAPTVSAAEVRDAAGMFSAEAVRSSTEALERAERVPVLIETITSLRDATTREEQRAWASKKGDEVINLLARRRDAEWGNRGLYLLLSKNDHLISNVLVSGPLARTVTESKRLAIRDAFIAAFKKGDFDAGLSRGVEQITATLAGVPATRAAGAPRLPGPADAHAPARPAGQRGGFPIWLTIALWALGAWFLIRILGGLFGNRGRAQGYPMGPGNAGPMGPGPMQPGYGGGYAGGGGGFFSGMLGGLGGALLGNWAYNHLGGGHHGSGWGGHADPTSSTPVGPTADDPQIGGGDIVGASDDGGHGASWGDSSTATGDWLSGGGDGGGDWGGGGGDWGGGGGDWGGDGGGGDW